MLELKDVTFGYDEKRPLFESVSLAIGPHERVSLAAPSGCGKTTLCRIMAGYVRPQRGAVVVDGHPLPHQGASPVQLVFQHPELAFDPRVRMRASLAEAGPLDGRLLEAFGVRDAWMTRFPHELSGGELMRFCVVRALMARPRYLICDEISTMLDAITQAQLWHAVIDEAARDGIGIVFVSHSPALVERIATRVIALADLA